MQKLSLRPELLIFSFDSLTTLEKDLKIAWMLLVKFSLLLSLKNSLSLAELGGKNPGIQ